MHHPGIVFLPPSPVQSLYMSSENLMRERKMLGNVNLTINFPTFFSSFFLSFFPSLRTMQRNGWLLELTTTADITRGRKSKFSFFPFSWELDNFISASFQWKLSELWTVIDSPSLSSRFLLRFQRPSIESKIEKWCWVAWKAFFNSERSKVMLYLVIKNVPLLKEVNFVTHFIFWIFFSDKTICVIFGKCLLVRETRQRDAFFRIRDMN